MTELLRCEELRRTFAGRGLRRGAEIVAVDRVSFALDRGETLGVVGESGSGKSTLGRLVLRLIEPSSGKVLVDGEDISQFGHREMRSVRRKMQAIFQNPYASLNPHFSIRQILEEPYRAHDLDPEGGWNVRLTDLLAQVGLDASILDRRPAKLSGGQLQRVAIARALALEPKLIVADEPTSALDVSIQAQILNLLAGVQQRLGVSYVFISHNLNVVGHLSDRIAVMYLGRFVETAPSAELYRRPLHPYTQMLLASVPGTDPAVERAEAAVSMQDEPPDASRIPGGCRFHPRCPFAEPICRESEPTLSDLGSGHSVACHFAPERTEEKGRAIAAILSARQARRSPLVRTATTEVAR